jgi:hypothetical protein
LCVWLISIAADQLHLVPLHATLQLRPTLSHVDDFDAKRRAAVREDDEEEEEAGPAPAAPAAAAAAASASLQPLQVRVA